MKQGIYLQTMAADAKEVVIDVVGVIGWEVWFPAMRDMLKAIPVTVERVFFDIYSPGGDVWEGNGIIQLIGEMKQETVARVQVAASMATLIAVACKRREIAANGRWLVHNPWTQLAGDAAAMEKRAKELRDCEAEAAKFYAARTGKTEAEMLALMAEERWLTPDEAMAFGFVQTINNPFDAAAFASVRAEIVAAGKWPVALAEIPITKPEDIVPPANKGGHSDDANTKGTAGDASATPPVSDAAAVLAAQIESARVAGFAAGKESADETLRAQLLTAADAVADKVKKLVDLQKTLEASTAEARKFQGERDQARALAEKHKTSLDDATAKLAHLLAGGLTFTPAIATWEEAMKACGGDYAKARNQFPEVYRAQRENDKANRK